MEFSASWPVQATVLIIVYLLNTVPAAWAVRTLLLRYRLPAPADGEPRVELARGRIIGILERLIVLTLVLMGQWGAIGFVMAAKSIARFKDLENRQFSEYYLIGTLASVLFAIATGLVAEAVLR
jgi:hypothetical protein